MVSIVKSGNSDVVAVLELYGKSTDVKPTQTIDGYNIPNGSTYFEMDTFKVFFYDEDAEPNPWITK